MPCANRAGPGYGPCRKGGPSVRRTESSRKCSQSAFTLTSHHRTALSESSRVSSFWAVYPIGIAGHLELREAVTCAVRRGGCWSCFPLTCVFRDCTGRRRWLILTSCLQPRESLEWPSNGNAPPNHQFRGRPARHALLAQGARRAPAAETLLGARTTWQQDVHRPSFLSPPAPVIFGARRATRPFV